MPDYRKQNNTNKPRKKLFDTQHDDEEVIYVFRRHPVVMRKGLIAFLIVVLIFMLPIVINPNKTELIWLWPLGIVVGVIIMFYVWIGWYFSLIILTNQRLINMNQKGLFRRSVVDLGVDKIQNVNYQIDGVQQTLLGFGTIVVQTFVGDLVIENMQKPKEVQESLIKVIKEYGEKTELK